MAKYLYKEGRRHPALGPQDVGEELEKIRVSAGELTPSSVVEASRPRDALLHDEFEWNKERAAHKYRLQQARNIINVVTVVPESPGKKRPAATPVQAFVSVTNVIDSVVNHRYRPIEAVLAEDDGRKRLLARCSQRLSSIRREYAALSECAALWEQIDALAAKTGSA